MTSKFCGSCGAARGDAGQAFCRDCGAPLSGAAPGASTGASTGAPAPAAPSWTPAPAAPAASAASGSPEYAVPAAGAPGGRRSRAGLVVGAGALVLALVGAGLVGWQFLGPQGGADSPKQAVTQLVEAAVSQDVVGALAMLNPGEVEGLDDLVGAARDRLAEEDLTAESGDLTDALTVSVDDLDLNTDELGDSAARVVLRSASYRVDYDPAALPDRLDFVAETYPEAKSWSGDAVAQLGYGLPDADWDNDRPDPYLMTARIDGRWYVTAAGTFLDVVLGAPSDSQYAEEGVRPPDYEAIDEERDPVVAKEPEDVLDNLADAVAAGDLEELLDNLPADEVAALRPWARTYEDYLALEDLSFDVSVDDVDADVDDLGGGLTRLTVDGATLSGSYVDGDDSGAGSVDVAGRCATADDGSERDTFCLEGEIAAKTGIDSWSVVLRSVDGGYQLDPIATAVEYARTFIDSAPSSLVDDALRELEADL